MRNLSLVFPTFILFHLLQHIATCAQIYTPMDDIAIDCGSSTSGNSAGPNGCKWTGDKDSKIALIEEPSNSSVSVTALSQSSSVEWVPYMTARISKFKFSYIFPVSAGQKFIRLHFYPAQYQVFDRSKAFFSVKVGPYTLLNNFSASLTADYLREASLIKEFCVNFEQNQSLKITFTPSTSTSYAFINGIELVSMPTSLYYSRFDDQGLPFLGQRTQFQIDNYTALQNVLRLNIGGQSISAMRDTGMYRNWYLVRLHFGEFDPSVEAVSDRRCRVYIDNKTAEEAFDVTETAGGKWIPIYKDYVVMIGNIGDKSEYALFIALHPNTIYSDYADAILNGLEVFKLNNSSGNLAGPNPLPETPTPGDEPSSPKQDKSNRKRKLLLSSGGGGTVLLILSTFLSYMVIWRRRKRQQYGSYHKLSRFCCWVDLYKGKSSEAKSSSLPDELYRHFSFDEIKAGTRDFDESLIIGVGGFGNVYRGFLDEGETIVAIKRLNPKSNQGAREFKNEIEMLSQLRHMHLVSLIGFCNDNNEMILVLKICHGAAIGLNYLHTEVKYTVIHCDVKTSNILLDDNFTAKVSDFGLSKMDPKIGTVDTKVKGTMGYLDPEYACGHALSENPMFIHLVWFYLKYCAQ
ncbi:hypothetical protein REPUB_Repub09cG0058700 [Reevesia pubescens]